MPPRQRGQGFVDTRPPTWITTSQALPGLLNTVLAPVVDVPFNKCCGLLKIAERLRLLNGWA